MQIVPAKQPQYLNRIYFGLFEDRCQVLPDQCVDLVLTSPPYGIQRVDQYGGISETDYPDWCVRWMAIVRRVLKPTGNVIIIHQPAVRHGQISDYMIKTILALRAGGWIECDRGKWIKPDAPPLGDTKRWRRTTENIHWFALDRRSYCNARSDAPNVFISPVAGVHRARWNSHPAQFPADLAAQIIEIFSPRRGIVLDPFIGSGSTAVAAVKTGRKYIGFEKEMRYVNIARRRVNIVRSNEISPARG